VVEGEDLGGGVVEGAEQSHARATALEPVVGAAIDLHELARGVFAGASTAMLRRAPAVDGGPAARRNRRTDSRETGSW
jgi:hypothetical protein